MQRPIATNIIRLYRIIPLTMNTLFFFQSFNFKCIHKSGFVIRSIYVPVAIENLFFFMSGYLNNGYPNNFSKKGHAYDEYNLTECLFGFVCLPVES